MNLTSERRLLTSTMKKNVLITGVSTGIGKDAVEYLLDNDFFVFGSVRTREDAQKSSNRWGPDFHPLIFDVTDEIAVSEAVEEVKEKVGEEGLFALINNAGIAVSGPLKYISTKRVMHQMEINVAGLLLVTQKFLPLLGGEIPSTIPPGRIINISSISGLIANPFMGPYSASKHAVEALTDVMRREFIIYNIKVIGIEPGLVKSEIWEKAKKEKYEFGSTEYDQILEKRRRIIEGMQNRSISTRKVSKSILKALLSKDPKTRYIVARKPWLIWLFAYILPDRFLDRLIFRNMKGDNIRAT